MNRAASLCWATAVALVLSASPAFAGKKVVTFPNKISHTRVVSHDALNTAVESSAVPEQTVTDRSGNNVVKFKPKGVSKVPKPTFKINLKNILKLHPGRAIAGAALMALISTIPGPEYDGYQLTKGTPAGTPQHAWGVQGFVGNCAFQPSAQAALDCYVAFQNAQPGNNATGFFWRSNHVVVASATAATGFYDTKTPQGGSTWALNSGSIVINGYDTCVKDNKPVACEPAGARTPFTEADFDTVANAIDSLSAAQLDAAYKEMIAINPEAGMFMPDYLTAPDGSMTQAMSSPLRKTDIARLNPDGTVSRLTRTEWGDFRLTYSPTSTNINYEVDNKTKVTDEAGETVEEETQTEKDEAEAPELSPALDSANDPLRDWATEIQTPPSSTTSGISYPLLFTYGGTCSVAPIVLPRIGSYSLDSICVAVNEWVKPILGVFFAAWSILHIFGVWRETTMNVRPS